MNLLPKSVKEFSQKDYWETFFAKRGGKAFEWYGDYTTLCEHLHKYIKKQDEILIPGCGNSTLGHQLYDAGFSNITNIDISQVVIRQMKDLERTRPKLRYLQMDALNTSFTDNSFGVLIDKSTLDALMPNTEPDTLIKIRTYFAECQRLLRIGGRYLCISLLQEHVLSALLEHFPSDSWMFRVVRCYTSEESDAAATPPVFLVICTRSGVALKQPIFEVNLSGGIKMQRFASGAELSAQIVSVQQAALICACVPKTSTAPLCDEDGDIALELYKPGTDGGPRYTVYIVDVAQTQERHCAYAAFIVPQGRESEWLFSTSSGRRYLASTTKNSRLIVITMHRDQVYTNLHDIQEELTDTVLTLAPSKLHHRHIPFLSVDSHVGSRVIRHRGTSTPSGDYIIEDVRIGEDTLRRLYFLSAPAVIQSEAKLKRVKRGPRRGVTTMSSTKEIVDVTQLTCAHHLHMSFGVHWSLGSVSKKGAAALVIGLGGGSLCAFLQRFLPVVRVTAVEIDAEIVQVATEWFGLRTDTDTLNVRLADGVQFLQEAVHENCHFEAVLFDVDSKDQSKGMSCPPEVFLQKDVLENVSRLIGTTGVFVLNVVLRNKELRPTIIGKLLKQFTFCASFQLGDDLNEIFFCSRELAVCRPTIENRLTAAYNDLEKFFVRHRTSCYEKCTLDDLLRCIQVHSNG